MNQQAPVCTLGIVIDYGGGNARFFEEALELGCYLSGRRYLNRLPSRERTDISLAALKELMTGLGGEGYTGSFRTRKMKESTVSAADRRCLRDVKRVYGTHDSSP
uniref:hypothetical protein n=1 Tax=Paenarthrobacter nicotinovorans TaxID=29320 RepID=UPI003F494765